jgi:large subunit ribosomal protein L34
MSKNTLNGTKRKAIKTSGFRARMATKKGRKILRNRRQKGRWKLAISHSTFGQGGQIGKKNS